MKVKELIEALLKEDPSQELDVCVGNKPIHFVENTQAYYDGPLQVLIQDKTCEYYNVIGAKFVRSGNKVQIHLLSIEDALLNDPEMPVTCENGRDETLVDLWRKGSYVAHGKHGSPEKIQTSDSAFTNEKKYHDGQEGVI